MEDPRQTSPGSVMPGYPWMLEKSADIASLPSKFRVQRLLGVPYPQMTDEEIFQQYREQAEQIAEDLRASEAYVAPESQVVALIAYLQKLGNSIPVAPAVAHAGTEGTRP